MIPSRELGRRICERLQIDPLRVERIDLHMEANNHPRAVITIILTDFDVNAILTTDDDQ